MYSNGNNLRNLTNHPGDDGPPNWSPDGQRITFQSLMDGNSNIYVMDPNGDDLRRLTDHLAFDGLPSWSSDSKQIAFVSERDLNYEIYVTDVNGINIHNLTNHPVYDFQPNWFNSDGYLVSPDSNLMTMWGRIKRACD